MSDRFRGAQVRDEDLGELCDHIAHDADEVAVGVGATVLLVLLSLVPQQARDPRKTSDPAIPPERVGTGTLAGRVTTLDGFEPIRHANVFLMGRTTGVIRITWSDANGRFLFGQLAPDAYIVGASKPPYLGSVAGARRPARPGTPIALGADQALLDVHIQMPLGAAIAGVIADEDPATVAQ